MWLSDVKMPHNEYHNIHRGSFGDTPAYSGPPLTWGGHSAAGSAAHDAAIHIDPSRTPFIHGEPHTPLSCVNSWCLDDWSGNRSHGRGFPPQADHYPACPQSIRPAQDMPADAHSCGCMTSYPQGPQTVPSPPPSDGSGNMSPHASQDWTSFGAGEVDPQMPKRIHLSACLDTSSEVIRPDGIRKKNAKFEIPQDRNLDTLDDLIKHAKNDTELKELKMQKRLLRNREAA